MPRTAPRLATLPASHLAEGFARVSFVTSPERIRDAARGAARVLAACAEAVG